MRKFYIDRVKLIACLLFIFALAAGCGGPSEPPQATALNLDGERMPMVRADYNWDGVQSDSPAPPELIRSENVYEFKERGGIQFEFEGEEPFNVSVGLIDMERPTSPEISTSVIVTDSTVTLPKEPGYYALHVQAVWSNEDRVNYALSIKIGEP